MPVRRFSDATFMISLVSKDGNLVVHAVHALKSIIVIGMLWLYVAESLCLILSGFLSTTEFTILSRTIGLQGWVSDVGCRMSDVVCRMSEFPSFFFSRWDNF